MSAFNIGQRVRIKWSRSYPELSGQEGTVVGKINDSLKWNEKAKPDGTNLYVAPDMWGSHIAPSGGLFAPSTSQLEPLTDSNDLVSWESMLDLWVPEHLRVKA